MYATDAIEMTERTTSKMTVVNMVGAVCPEPLVSGR